MSNRRKSGKRNSAQIRRSVYDCVGIGICPSDYICLLDRYPGYDEKVVARKCTHQGGGPVATAFAALGRWGARTAVISVIGDDEDGRFVREQLEADGVDTSLLRVKKGTGTARAFILVDVSRGGRTVVLDVTNTPEMKARDIRIKDLPPCRVFHTDGRDAEACVKAMRHYRKTGAKVCIDAGSMRRHMDEMIEAATHFVASHEFIPQYFGEGVSPEEACRRVLEMGPEAAVVTLGSGGCLGVTGEGAFRISGYRKKDFIVDTNGAGDVFHGGYIYGLLQGWDDRECAEYANAAAFLKCSKPGGRAGIPRVKDVLALLKENPPRRSS